MKAEEEKVFLYEGVWKDGTLPAIQAQAALNTVGNLQNNVTKVEKLSI